ncbi:Eco57I restriction-modification methylase domain-containing protein [Parasphingorhabdus sp. DH2-15]|uniref:Eco57I restriction-modification methylase domain-containing protein n=1 Tax=Parasphingorhabdus sp. DH2-15 TaxID=3444112 RepID=UPI003F687E71
MQLFNKKTIARHIGHAGAPDATKLAILSQWAANINSAQIHSQKETALAGEFKQKIMVEVLGYAPSSQSGEWNIDVETQIGGGRVDLAIGQFSATQQTIIAPFELKGADTKNLDAIMPGRAKTPVEQAWEYASDNVGSKWVCISNYLEIRLYSYADGKLAYEYFDLRRLPEAHEYHRFMLLMSAENLLGGRTHDLLAQSKREDKDITNALYADYKVLRSDLIGAVQANTIDPLEAIGIGQTILDRILFIAFAEDNGLVPDNSIMGAYEHHDPYNPKPVWQNFLGLFTAIDQGNDALNIPKYNGGLFRINPIIRELEIADQICEGFKRLAEYDFASEISVTVLGHIFEQSIADVEALQAEARGEIPAEKKTSGTSGRRKRDGVVYTPDYVARFIVDQTLGTHCREIFARLLQHYAKKGARPDDEPIAWKNKSDAEQNFWNAYRDALTRLRIVDPACGSGVFLIMAFDWLRGEITKCNLALETLGQASLYEPDSEILTNNLFGVDVNSESVEIAKLSLWIKTARRGKVLDSLDENIKVGDSLIEDASFAYRQHGFEWKTAFPDIFAAKDGGQGGFDIVLGNPPYVRQELLSDLKPYLQKRFAVYHGVADLYAYFFERGLRLLKPGGRMGYISSSTFFKTGSGKPLRSYLRQKATLETVVDFGDNQIFEGVTTYPAILTMRAEPPAKDHKLNFWTIDDLPADNFVKTYHANSEPYPQNALTDGSWELESPALQKLRAKIVTGKKTLKDVYGSPYRGILTGRNDAFVIDRATRDRLIAEDPKSSEILKPWLEGKDIKRWRTESRDLWLILFKRGWTIDAFGAGDEDTQWEKLQEEYPAIAAYLAPHATACKRRTDKGDYWWELRACTYYDLFDGTAICYPEISQGAKFSLSSKGTIPNKTVFSLFSEDLSSLAFLNSNVTWFYFGHVCTALRGGQWRLLLQSIYVSKLPIPNVTPDQKAALGTLAETAQNCAEKRYALQHSITRRIGDLANDPAAAKLSTKLKTWWRLPDFAAFQKEVKKSLKADIPVKERNDWESWTDETRTEINNLTAQIQTAEDQINAMVYTLFDLTDEEIDLLEANI